MNRVVGRGCRDCRVSSLVSGFIHKLAFTQSHLSFNSHHGEVLDAGVELILIKYPQKRHLVSKHKGATFQGHLSSEWILQHTHHKSFNVKTRESQTFITAAVKPTPLLPLPVVYCDLITRWCILNWSLNCV